MSNLSNINRNACQFIPFLSTVILVLQAGTNFLNFISQIETYIKWDNLRGNMLEIFFKSPRTNYLLFLKTILIYLENTT